MNIAISCFLCDFVVIYFHNNNIENQPLKLKNM